MQVFLILILTTTFILESDIYAQFIDDFSNGVNKDIKGNNVWECYTGSGKAEISFKSNEDGGAIISLDASRDEMNVWWGIIKRNVAEFLDLEKLSKDDYELRVETKIKVSHAPRRVNLHFNTQRTTDFHSHLREFDIDDTTNWHIISMTTEKFDVTVGDDINVQLALMDWGHGKYHVILDYLKVDVVNINEIGPDLGNPQIYHPPIPEISSFSHHLIPVENATISSKFKDQNFFNWSSLINNDTNRILSVSDNRIIIMKWNLSRINSDDVEGPGLLELWCHSFTKNTDIVKDFGLVRICEILSGQENWTDENVTFNRFLNGNSFDDVINPQMIVDVDIKNIDGKPNLIFIPEVVLQRLFLGKTKGIALLPLGAVEASFHSNKDPELKYHPKLYFNIKR